MCFLAGLFFSAFSLLGGMGHFGGHIHLPHGAQIPHLPHVGHAAGPRIAGAHGAAGGGAHAGATVPWWNLFSAMIFLCWFGAAGYLLTEHSGFAAGVVVALAAVFGMLGLNGFPHPYHPLFNVKRFADNASRDGFFIAIESNDAKFNLDDTRRFLESLSAKEVTEVPR